MSRLIGPHTADPCPRCADEAVRLGTPSGSAGPAEVGYTCDRCGHFWSRLVETDLAVHDTVRADLPDATLYGTVWSLEDDRVLLRGPGGDWNRWVEHWRVILY
ncbi:hypothetical protein [Streptomyces maremycinicus]|uniref:hypothetical protein n=1 Tax=Streptomyces maremycinicus TaxID=1679753 RepID=UPI000786B77B|nr:hypothetical protein [Streptomyces sp. NBRC 110468]